MGRIREAVRRNITPGRPIKGEREVQHVASAICQMVIPAGNPRIGCQLLSKYWEKISAGEPTFGIWLAFKLTRRRGQQHSTEIARRFTYLPFGTSNDDFFYLRFLH